MTQQITELCLITDAGVVPFAVLVEQDDLILSPKQPMIKTEMHQLVPTIQKTGHQFAVVVVGVVSQFLDSAIDLGQHGDCIETQVRTLAIRHR